MASVPGTGDGWSIERASHGGGGISAFAVRTRTGDRLMVKVARTDAGHASLARSAEAQRAMTGIGTLGPWRAKVPEVRSDGEAGAWRFVVETILAGRPLSLPAPDDAGWSVAMAAAVAAITELHGRTASTDPNDGRRARWVERRVAVAAALGPTLARGDAAVSQALGDGLIRLEALLGEQVDAMELSAGWIHGDYWSANILVAGSGQVTGIVDWDSAERDELPAQDVFHLVLYARKLRRRGALGRVVADLLGGGGLDPRELEVLDRARPPGLDLRATTLLYWLRFVESNLRRQPALASSERWIASNVGAVVPWL
jgi:aminoglycoside phosphotransferase (APT) family kinase protein